MITRLYWRPKCECPDSRQFDMKKTGLILCALVCFLNSGVFASAAGVIPSNGEWRIGDEVTLEDEVLARSGDIVIQNGGSLTCRRMEIWLTAQDADAPTITLRPGGVLRLLGSVLRGDPEKGFRLVLGDRAEPVQPTRVEIRGSELHKVVSAGIYAIEGAVIENCRILIHGAEPYAEGIALNRSVGCTIRENEIRVEPLVSSGLSRPAAFGIGLEHSRENVIVGNRISDVLAGITLGGAWNNTITNNICIGPIGEPKLKERTSKWWSVNTTERLGEGAILVGVGSHNNTIKNNQGYLSNTMVFFLGRSSHNRFLGNTIKGGKIGLAILWAKDNVIHSNDFADIWRYDAIHSYRGANNWILGNRFTSVAGAIGLFSSKGCVLQGNRITDAGRGVFLHDSAENLILNNDVRSTAMPLVLSGSSSNKVRANNFPQKGLQRFDDGGGNLFEGNYWGDAVPSPVQIPPKGRDGTPASGVVAIISPEEPDLGAAEYREPALSDAVITENVVWQDRELDLKEGFSILQGGSLTLKNVTLRFAPQEMPISYTRPGNPLSIQVRDGGSLTIRDSRIEGPPEGLCGGFQIIAAESAVFSMKNSEIRNAGWWGGDAAVALEDGLTGGIVENCVFENIYCAVNLENVSDCSVTGNRISTAVIGIMVLGGKENTIARNRISDVGWGGIELYGPTSAVSNNTISDGWGIAIIPFWDRVPANNGFSRFRGPAHRYAERTAPIPTSAVSFKVFSLDPVDVIRGDPVRAWVRVAHAFPYYGDRPVGEGPQSLEETVALTLAVDLMVNGISIDRELAAIRLGHSAMVELEGIAPEDGVMDVGVEQSACASLLTSSARIHIPCLDLGDCFWLDLGMSAAVPFSLSIADFGVTWCRDPRAIFQTGANLLKVPCLSLGNLSSYWFDLVLQNPATLTFELTELGEN